MSREQVLVSIAGVIAAATLLSRARFRRKSSRVVSASGEDAKKSAELMKDWAVWLAAIQTAVISGLLVLYGGRPFPALALAGIGFLGSSLLLETVLLAGLPSVVLRLKPTASEDNDIYELPLFVFWRLRAGAVYLLAHWCFLFGVAFVALQFLIHGVPRWPH